MKLLDLINEEEKQLNRKFQYGCAMIFFNFPEMFNIHNKINPDDLYTEPDDDSFGLDDEPHVTLLYGFHDTVTTDDILEIVDKYTFGNCDISNPSLFKKEKYDVLKYDVLGDSLHEANKELTKLPHTTDYPDYHPHMTIGYIKKGRGQKYVDMLKKYKPFTISPVFAVYSKTDGNRDRLKIKIK